MSSNYIEARIKSLKALEDQKSFIASQIEEIKDEVKQEMLSRGVDEIITTSYSISWKEIISNRLNTTELKKQYKDLYNNFLRPVTTRKFSVA